MKIQEILNEAYQYRIDPSSNPDKTVAEFNYGQNNSRTMKMAIEVNAYGFHEIKFYPKEKEGQDNEFEMDSTGNARSILQTVTNFVDEWYSKNKDHALALVAGLATNNEKKRSRVYSLMLSKLQKKHGGTISKKPDNVYWYTPKYHSSQFDDNEEDDYNDEEW